MSNRKRKVKPDAHGAITKAIDDLIAETRLAYEFCPGSYTYAALNASFAIKQVYERDAEPDQVPDWVALYLDYHHGMTLAQA